MLTEQSLTFYSWKHRTDSDEISTRKHWTVFTLRKVVRHYITAYMNLVHTEYFTLQTNKSYCCKTDVYAVLGKLYRTRIY